MSTENGVAFNAHRHTKNARGKWYDKIGKRLVRIDPATIPAELAGAPGARVVAELQGVELPDVSAVAAQPSAPSDAGAAPQPIEAPAPQAPNVLDLDAPAPSGPPVGPGIAPVLPGLGLEPGVGGHVHGCWRAQAEGTVCGCGAKFYEPMPDSELSMMVDMYEPLVNRFANAPRPFDAEERARLMGAFRVFSTRYGNPAAKYAPLLAVAVTSYGVVAARQLPAAAEPARQGPEA